jgi:putative ABC transport system permease protein
LPSFCFTHLVISPKPKKPAYIIALQQFRGGATAGKRIMNIMLVSVTERTREIGLRMAVGAKARHILTQFLVEAVVLAVLGGAIGIGLGLLVSYGVEQLSGWRIELSLWSIALAAGFSAAVGIFFGWYPARKASRLLPIQALRYE